MKKEVKGKNKVIIKRDGKTTVLKPKLKLMIKLIPFTLQSSSAQVRKCLCWEVKEQ